MPALSVYTIPFTAMGSPCQLRLLAENAALAQQMAAPMLAEVQRLEATYSRYLPTSVLSHINANAGIQPVKVDAEMVYLLNYAQALYQQSEGLFDVTSGVLRCAWDFQRPQLPADSVIQSLLALVGWHKVDWQPPWVFLPVAGMQLDLGGLVKEYAADVLSQCAVQQGVAGGLVEMGGDIRVIGEGNWPLGVRNPKNPSQALLRLRLEAGGFASSGNYARCFILNGKRYSHILNPKTGWPVASPASVSVIADTCLLAGSITTVAMLKGEEACLQWLEEVGLPFACVFNDGRVVNTF